MRAPAIIAATAGAFFASAIATHAEFGGTAAEFFARDRGMWQGDSASPYGRIPTRIHVRRDRKLYAAIVAREARRQGVPVRLALAVAKQESGFNPRAMSRQHAMGLMQIIPSTWRAQGCTGSPWNPEDNARCGVHYLAQGLREGGAAWAVARYHGGPNRRWHGRKTRHYQRVVLAAAGYSTRVAYRHRPASPYGDLTGTRLAFLKD